MVLPGGWATDGFDNGKNIIGLDELVLFQLEGFYLDIPLRPLKK